MTDHSAKIFLGGGDWTTTTVKVKLFTNTSDNISVTTTTLAGITNVEASGGGYAAATVGSPVITAISNGDKASSADVQWTATGGNISAWRKAVFYFNSTVEGVVDPVIGYFLGDSTPADVPATTDTNILKLTCPAGGWFDLTHT
jgi:hypothetical protein